MEKFNINDSPNSKRNLFFGIMLFIFGLYSIFALKEVLTFDYWWHVKTGEYVLTTGTVPKSDVFSWYGIAENLKWHSHEWLSGVIYAFINNLFGQGGGYIIACFMYIAIGLMLFILNRSKYYKNYIFSSLWMLLGALCISSILNPRPHMLSFPLFILVIKILIDFTNNKNEKFIYTLPFITILWVNLHGGSSNLPYVLCLIVAFVGSLNLKIGKIEFCKMELTKIKKLLLMAFISMIAILFNPHGFDMFLYPYINMGDSFMMQLISEWRAPDLKIGKDIIIYAVIAVPWLMFLVSKKEIKGLDFILILAFTYLTFKSIRFAPFLYITSNFIVFDYVKERLNIDFKVLGICFFLTGTLFSLMFVLDANKYYSEFKDRTLISDEKIDIIKKSGTNKLFNVYDYGGYLIYKDVQPFIDGRADMYSGHTLEDYDKIAHLRENALELIEKYDFDSYLIYSGTALDNYLSQNKDYRLVFKDTASETSFYIKNSII